MTAPRKKPFVVPLPKPKPEPKPEKSGLERFNEWVEKNKIASAIAILALVIGGLATFTDDVDKIVKNIRGWFEEKKADTLVAPDTIIKRDTTKHHTVVAKTKFSVTGIALAMDEIRLLQDSTGKTFSLEKEKLQVTLTYNHGAMTRLPLTDKELYRFNGSSVNLVIGGIICYEFSPGIPASSSNPRSKAELIASADAQLAGFISRNRAKIIHQIMLCLKNYPS